MTKQELEQIIIGKEAELLSDINRIYDMDAIKITMVYPANDGGYSSIWFRTKNDGRFYHVLNKNLTLKKNTLRKS